MRIRCSVLPYRHLPSQTSFRLFRRPWSSISLCCCPVPLRHQQPPLLLWPTSTSTPLLPLARLCSLRPPPRTHQLLHPSPLTWFCSSLGLNPLMFCWVPSPQLLTLPIPSAQSILSPLILLCSFQAVCNFSPSCTLPSCDSFSSLCSQPCLPSPPYPKPQWNPQDQAFSVHCKLTLSYSSVALLWRSPGLLLKMSTQNISHLPPAPTSHLPHF